MNIFVTDICPSKSAYNLDDKRVVKMALETAQILSTALNGPYKPTHRNHPAVIWAAANRAHQFWLVRHGLALCETYTLVYGRRHASLDVIMEIADMNSLLPCHNTLMPSPIHFNNSARHSGLRLDFTDEAHVTASYRNYLSARWAADKRTPTWQRRAMPEWRAV